MKKEKRIKVILDFMLNTTSLLSLIASIFAIYKGEYDKAAYFTALAIYINIKHDKLK